MSEVTFTFRVDPELKAAFVRVAKERNRNASILLRDYMQQFVVDQAKPAVDVTPRPVAKTANA